MSVMSDRAVAYQERRSELVHDNLKNTLNSRLRGVQTELGSFEPSLDYLLDRLKSVPNLWKSCYEEAIQLLEEFEDAMSPRTLLSERPLQALEPASRKWLGRVVHECWHQRYAIGERLNRARDALLLADQLCERIVEALPGAPDLDDVHGIEELLEAFAEACDELRSHLRALPTEVSVT